MIWRVVFAALAVYGGLVLLSRACSRARPVIPINRREK